MADDIDTELFIEKIRKHPEIWDFSSESYKDKNKKQAAWISVCQQFITNFDEKDEQEKNELGKKLMARWKSIRDGYVRNVRKRSVSGQAAGYQRSYIFAKQLSFLHTAKETAVTESSINVPESEANEEIVEATKIDEKPNQCTKLRKGKKIEDVLIKFMENPDPPSNFPNTMGEDDDKSFLNSLLPSLKSFSEDEKLEFRLNTLNCIKAIRQKRLRPNPYYSSQLQPVSYQIPHYNTTSNYILHHASPTPQTSQPLLSPTPLTSSYIPQTIENSQPLPSPSLSTSSHLSDPSTSSQMSDTFSLFQ